MNDCIIVTFTDYKYLKIFNIFYSYFKRLNLQLLVVSLDNTTFIELTKRKINTLYKPYNINNKEQFWEFRLNCINELFKKFKKNIIHTDADCFWFKNILYQINKLKDDYDIIGSIAYSHPKFVSNKWGFVFCCGFYFIKYTDKNALILDTIKRFGINMKDDQVQFNYYLYNNVKVLQELDDSVICKDIILNDNTKVGILSNTIVSREYNKDLYCFHPFLFSKNIYEKKEQIKKMILS